MTEGQLFMKMDSLAGDLPGYVIQSMKKIRESGEIDLDSYEDNYLLPKMMMAAILRRLSGEYMPISPTKAQKTKIEVMACIS